MNNQPITSISSRPPSRISLATVNFVEDGRPVKGARVTITPTFLPVVNVECALLGFQTFELVTDETGYAEHPLVCGSEVSVAVDLQSSVQTIKVPDDVESFELIGYPPVQ